MNKQLTVRRSVCVVMTIIMAITPYFGTHVMAAEAPPDQQQTVQQEQQPDQQQPDQNDQQQDQLPVQQEQQPVQQDQQVDPAVDQASTDTGQDEPQQEDLTQQEVLPEGSAVEDAPAFAEEEEAVEEPVPEISEFIYEDRELKVTATLSEPGAIPADAKLSVTPVTKDSEGYNYDAYMNALNKGSDVTYSEYNTLLYDIAFILDGVEIQPSKGTVNIAVTFKDNQLTEALGAANAGDVSVIHLPLRENVREQYDTTADATDIKAKNIIKDEIADNDLNVSVKKETVEFDLNGLSVAAFSTAMGNVPQTDAETFAQSPFNILGYPDDFGEMANFGLIGFDKIDLAVHTNSNFATKHLTGNAARGTNKLGAPGELFYIGESMDMTGPYNLMDANGNYNGSQIVFGSGFQIDNEADNGNRCRVNGMELNINGPSLEQEPVRQERPGQKYIDLDAWKQKADDLSKRFSKFKNTNVSIRDIATDKMELVDETAVSVATLNIDATDLSKKIIVNNTAVNEIDHVIVINVDAKGQDTVNIRSLRIETNGSGNSDYTGEINKWTGGNVILNVIDSTQPDGLFRGKVTNEDQVSASILAPEAIVDVPSNVNGEIIAKEIVIRGEFHRDSITFPNRIEIKGGLTAAKELDGSRDLGRKTFDFKLTALDGAPLPSGEPGTTMIVQNEGNGQILFGYITFDSVTQYRYQIEEVIPEDAETLPDGRKYKDGIIYDTAKYTVAVKTAYKDGSRTQIVIDGYDIFNEAGEKINSINYEAGKTGVVTFKNDTAQTKANVKVTKAFNGWNKTAMADRQFEFELTGKDEANNPLKGETRTAFATKDAPVADFGTIEFRPLDEDLGTYHFTLREKIPEGAEYSDDGKTAVKDGIVYDAQEHTVTIEYKKVDGRYVTETTYDNGNENLTVSNTYEQTQDKLKVKKTWKTADGQTINGTGSVQFKLRQISTPQAGGASGEERPILLKTGKYVVENTNTEYMPDGSVVTLKVRTVEGETPTVRTYGGSGTFHNHFNEVNYSSRNGNEYTYTITIAEGIDSIEAHANYWDVNLVGFDYSVHKPSSGGSAAPTEAWYPADGSTYSLSAANSWKDTFNMVPTAADVRNNHDLPLEGNGVTYTYKVVEVDAAGNEITENVTYTNNDGVVTGEIGIVNTVEERTGSLKIRKKLTQNGSESLSGAVKQKLAGTYSFGIYKNEACSEAVMDGDQPMTVTLTIGSNGQPVTSEEITGLPEGTYWIKEVLPTNGSVPVQNPVPVVVSADKTGDAAPIAEFTNNYETGSLTVAKTVVSNEARDKTQKFTFTVKLSDTSISGTYGDMTFDKGVAVLQLADGETATASDLPKGVTYTVEETAADGFDTEVTGNSGAIGNGAAVASFTNTRETGDIEVSKSVVSDASADADREFTFTVTLSDTGINGTYGTGDTAMTFENGVATFTLKGGEKATATGLPTGITYTVTEAVDNSFTTKVDGAAGTVSAQKTVGKTKTATAFENTRKTGDLSVSKTVASNTASDKTKEFSFTVTLSDTGINGTYGNGDAAMTFNNGVATFTLKDGETKTATGLPIGITYVVAEQDAAGFVTTSAGETGEISTTASAAAFTNTRNEGGLIVSKAVVSPLAADLNRAFNFTVTLDDDTITGTYGGMEFNNGIATFTLKNGETKQAEGLPQGIRYTVTEGADALFTTTPEVVKGEISKDTGTAAFTNTRKTGELEVSKTLNSDAGADQDKIFSFKVTLSDKTISGTFGGMTFDKGVAVFGLKKDQSLKATGLPIGVTYTVEETDVDGNMTVTATGGGRTATGTISGQISMAAFTNTHKTGDLSIKKKVNSVVAADHSKAYAFTVTLSDSTISGTYGDMTFADGVANVDVTEGTVKTAAGLPAGITYTVTEAAYSDFDTVGTTDTEGTITAGKTVTAEFANTKKTGGLEVSKTVSSNRAKDKNTEFEFTVELSDKTINSGILGTGYGEMVFENGVATFKLKDGETKKAENLPVGITYTVTETPVNDYTITNSGEAGTITDGTASAVFTNTKDQGGLTVSKELRNAVAADSDKEFSFTVTLDDTTVNGTFGEMTFVNGVAQFTLKGGEAKTATGLARGIGYKVTEASASDFTTGSTGAEGTISAESAQEKFINTKNNGELSVHKVLRSSTAADQNKEFVFTVTLDDKTIQGKRGNMDFTDGEATFTLKANETKTAKDLPIGLSYTVNETNADGFAATYTGQTGTIKATPAFAEVTNTRAEGDLKISKTVVSEAAADAGQEFTFQIELNDANVDGDYSGVSFVQGKASITLKGGESKLIEGLPAGTTYEVKEVAVGGFVTEKTGSAGEIGSAVQTAAFTNTRETGDLEVSKSVTSSTASDKTKEFKFTVTLSDTTIGGTEGKAYGGMTFKEGVATFTLKDGESKTATGLPTGIHYTVEEENAAGFITTVNGADAAEVNGTITTTKAVEAFANAKDEGGLIVSKAVVSDKRGDADLEFNFTVELSDKTVNGTYGDMTFVEGIATFTLKGGEQKEAAGLAKGIKYIVTEAEAEGFDTKVDGAEGTVSAEKTIGAQVGMTAFENTHKTGDIEVSKTVVSDAAADADQQFTFTVTLSDTGINGTYGTGSKAMTFENGVATFTLKGGEKATATGLPTGITYTVSETADNSFTTKVDGAAGTVSNGIIVSPQKTVSETRTATAFENTKKTGDLSVSKSVTSSTASDKTKEFGFTVTLSDTTIGGTEGKAYGDMTFKEGVATFTLKDDETKTATGLPIGITYTVTEDENTATGFVTTMTGDTGKINTGGSAAFFTNTKEEGGLLVSKSVSSDLATDKNIEFRFTVTLDDTSVNGTYGKGDTAMTFKDGVATFTLKDGETKNATGLAKGIKYTVTETGADGFNKQMTGSTGTMIIKKNETASAVFTNTRKTGSLTISKEVVSGAASDHAKAFTFTIQLQQAGENGTKVDALLNGTYSGVTFENGRAQIQLMHNESKTIEGLPEGLSYVVTEAEDGSFITDATGTSGSISAATPASAAFKNTRKTGGLEVSKTVISPKAADLNAEYAFTVSLSDRTVSGKFGGMIFNDGIASFTLKHDQTVKAEGLPAGVTYTVEEEHPDGFTVFSTGESGTITVDQSVKAAFKNYKAEGEIVLEGTKYFENGDLTKKEFVFGVFSDLTAEKPFCVGRSTPSEDSTDNGVITFNPIKYTYEDILDGNTVDGHLTKTFTYYVKEITPEGLDETGFCGDDDIEYDTEVREIEVTVTDQGDGTLDVSTDPEKAGLNFTNELDEDREGAITITAEKTVNKGKPSGEDTFSFILEKQILDEQNVKTWTEVDRTTNNGDAISFNTIEYSKADIGKTYTYRVREVKGDSESYVYDETVYTVTVAIAKGARGKLDITKTITKGDETVDAISFDNKKLRYEADYGEIKVKKINPEGKPLKDAEFTLYNGEAPVATYTTGADGTAVISTMDSELSSLLPKVGETADLILKETKAPKYYKVDQSAPQEYQVKLATTQAESEQPIDGAYVITTTYGISINEAAEVQVTNIHKEKKGTLNITKAFEGGNLTDEEKGAITFTVTGPEGFEPQTKAYSEFSEEGVWTLTGIPIGTYTVTEENADKKGYARTTTYKVNGESTEKAEALLEPEETVDIELTNTYVERDFNGTIVLNKLGDEGKALEGAVFDLYKVTEGGNGEPAEEKVKSDLTTGKDGQITVSNLQAGTYFFQETAAPEGYILPPEEVARYYVNLSLEDASEEVLADTGTAENPKPVVVNKSIRVRNTLEIDGTIFLIKKDSVSGQLLEGAVFDLYRVGTGAQGEDELIKKDLTTGDNGAICETGLKPGKYYFLETRAPEDCALPTGEAAKSTVVTIEEPKFIEDDPENPDAVMAKQEPQVATIEMENQREWGRLLLTKTIDEYVDDTKTNAVMTFRITGKNPDGTAFEQTRSIRFDAKTNTSQTISMKVPLGCILTVEEIYSGNYKPEQRMQIIKPEEITWKDPETGGWIKIPFYKVNFKNNLVRTVTGKSIINQYGTDGSAVTIIKQRIGNND